MPRHSSVRAALITTTVIGSLPVFAAVALAQAATDLDDINVDVTLENTNDAAAAIKDEAPLDADDVANSGKSTLSNSALLLRGIGQDANTAFRTLPNVHYRSDVDEDNKVNDDIGEGADDVLDLQPEKFSISGARVNENNIMIDGVGINSVVQSTGNTKPQDGATVPQLTDFYGVHPQNQYIPTSMVEDAELMDSNVSAQYGGFLGGVVNYKLRKPSVDEASSGTLSFSYQNDKFTKYEVGTKDGTNPDNRNKPKWTKMTLGLDYSMPVSDHTALMFGYATQRANAEKQRAPQFGSEIVESSSKSDFYRFAATHELDNGSRLTGALNLTDYEQIWNLEQTRNAHLDIKNRSLMGQVGYERDLDDLGFVKNAKLDLGLSFQRNKVSNESNENTYYNWIGMDWRGNDLSANVEGCDPVAGAGSQNCAMGGLGNKSFDDKRIALTADLSGDMGNGTFRSGLSFEQYNVNRKGSGFEYYTSAFANAGGVCNAGDPSCNAEQYFWNRVTQDAYDADVKAYQVAAYAEIEQSFGDFDLRAGVRADYNDVLKNTDIAPRLTATWAATDDLSVTVGANRYYDDNYLAYAVHDALPLTKSWLRFGDPTLAWRQTYDAGNRSYSGNNLKTPYNDEITFAVTYQDSFSDGLWRLRALKRDGKDLFSNDTSSSSTGEIKNEATSEYKSLSVEYQKAWTNLGVNNLDGLGLHVTATWSDSKRSSNSYFTNDTTVPQRIWYNGQGYEGSEWNKVTGNLDQPARGSVELRSSWFNGGMNLGLMAEITGNYTGVIDTGSNYTNPADGLRYDMFEDHAFKRLVNYNLNASFRVADLGNGKDVMLDVKVNNLFDARPAGTATRTSPWVPGRTVWVGTEIEF